MLAGMLSWFVSCAWSAQPLHTAADHADVTEVAALLQAGVDPNTPDDRGRTPLWCLLQAAWLAEDRASLAYSSDPVHELVTHQLDDALVARKVQEEAVLRLLADAGADLDRPDPGEHTPLVWTTGRGGLRYAELLLELGADPQRTGPDGRTPLQLAIDQGDEALIVLLGGTPEPPGSSAAPQPGPPSDTPQASTVPTPPELLLPSSALEPRIKVPPRYPEAARDQQRRGPSHLCVAEIAIDPTGTPWQVEVSGCPEIFAAPTEAALLQWRWYPPRHDDAIVATRTRIQIHYVPSRVPRRSREGHSEHR